MSKEEYRKSQEEAMENRLGHYRGFTNEELEIEKEQIEELIDYYDSILDNKNSSSEQKSEIKNSDRPYEKEKLAFVNKVLEERKSNNIKRR